MANTNVPGFNIAFKRGTTAQNNNYTGPEGTFSIDITKKEIRYHDGVTAGGFGVNGNASTATKLATPVNINGVAFDGSASITIVDNTKLAITTRDAANGVAALDSSKKISESYIPTTLVGNYIFDLTAITAISNPSRVTNGIYITHSNIFSNTDPYGSGCTKIMSTGYRNNQTLLYLSKDSLPEDGNSTQLVIENRSSGATTSVVTDSAIELLSRNLNTGQSNSARNGKMKIRIVSGNSGSTNDSDGYGEIMFRRGPLHASGDNSGFEVSARFRPITTDGMMSLYGTGGEIVPTYTNTGATFSINNTFHTSSLSLVSTASDYTLSSVWIDLKSNSTINAGTANTGQFRILSSATSGRLEFRDLNNGNVPFMDYQQGTGGTWSFYDTTDATKGSLRLGNNTRNMKMSGVDNVFNFTSNNTSTSTRLTVEGYFVKFTRVTALSATEGGSYSLPAYSAQDEVILINTATNLAAFTLTLPNITPKEGQTVTISCRQGSVAALTITSSLAGVTIFGANPLKLVANSSVTIMYRTNGSQWWVIMSSNITRAELGVANGIATLDSTGIIPIAQVPDFFRTAISATTLNFGATAGDWTVSIDGSNYVNIRRNLNNNSDNYKVIQTWCTHNVDTVSYNETLVFSGTSNIIVSKDNAGANKAMVANTIWTAYLLDSTTTTNPAYKIEVSYFNSLYNLHVTRID